MEKKKAVKSKGIVPKCVFCDKPLVKGKNGKYKAGTLITLLIRLGARVEPIDMGKNEDTGIPQSCDSIAENCYGESFYAHPKCAEANILCGAIPLDNDFFMTDRYGEDWNTLIQEIYKKHTPKASEAIHGISELGLIIHFQKSMKQDGLYHKVKYSEIKTMEELEKPHEE